MDSYAKLRWQCRRGSKELDLLLQQYLVSDYPQADEVEKKWFAELLQLEDSELEVYLLQSDRFKDTLGLSLTNQG